MARVDPATLDWDTPVTKDGGDWVAQLVAHWEVILEAFSPYRGDVLAERAIRSCEESFDERPEPVSPDGANLRFRRIRDFARAEVRHAQQRARRQQALAEKRAGGGA